MEFLLLYISSFVQLPNLFWLLKLTPLWLFLCLIWILKLCTIFKAIIFKIMYYSKFWGSYRGRIYPINLGPELSLGERVYCFLFCVHLFCFIFLLFIFTCSNYVGRGVWMDRRGYVILSYSKWICIVISLTVLYYCIFFLVFVLFCIIRFYDVPVPCGMYVMDI